MWMFGTTEGVDVEVTGYLPVIRSMDALRAAVVAAVGERKRAVQKGRTIATLKQGSIAGLTGTFAFLSDGDGPIFG